MSRSPLWRGLGEAILEHLVKSADGAESSREIAWAVFGKRDGRKVTRALAELEQRGLVVYGRTLYWPTPRGREVDAILDRITHARGGEFASLRESGITFTESYALRYGTAP